MSDELIEEPDTSIEETDAPDDAPIKKRSNGKLIVAAAAVAAIAGGGYHFFLKAGAPYAIQSSAQVDSQNAQLIELIEATKTASAERTAQLEADQKQALTALEDRLSSAIAERQPIDDLATQIAAIDSAMVSLADRLATLEARSTAFEAPSAETEARYTEQLAEMRAMIDREVARLSDLEQKAEGANLEAARAGVLNELRQRMDDGQPFDALNARAGDLPQALAALAPVGVPTLAQLQSNFPDFARATIEATAAQERTDGEQSFLQNLLYTQLGYRSTAPKEGTSVDAILSRAEHALKSADLTSALSELDGLAEAPTALMADWTNEARARVDALAAFEIYAGE